MSEPARRLPILERARAVQRVVAEHTGATFEQGRLPEPVLAAMIEADLFQAMLPASAGGEERTPQDFAEIAQILGEADMSTGWCFVQAGFSAYGLGSRLDEDTARTVFSEPSSVVAAGWPKGSNRADKVEGGYLVTGEWDFGSGSLHASWFDLRATIYENGVAMTPRPGMPAQASLLAPRESVEILDDSWTVTGMRGTGSCSYRAREVFVPANRAVPLFQHPEWHDRPLFRFPAISAIHISFASVALGGAAGALQDFRELAITKVAASASQPLARNAAAQIVFGRAQAKVRAALAYRDRAIGRAWERALVGRVPVDELADVRLAAVSGVEVALEVIDILYRTAGTSGIFEGSPLYRRFQDVHVLAQQSFARQAHYENVARMMFGLDFAAAAL